VFDGFDMVISKIKKYIYFQVKNTMYHNNKHAFEEASDYQAYGHNFNHYITTLRKKNWKDCVLKICSDYICPSLLKSHSMKENLDLIVIKSTH